MASKDSTAYLSNHIQIEKNSHATLYLNVIEYLGNWTKRHPER